MMLENRHGTYTRTTYKEMQTAVHRCVAGLLQFGIACGDRIALLSEGRNDWFAAELSILYNGAINVPLSVKIEELPELTFRLAHPGYRMIIVSRAYASKIRKIKHDLPDLEKIILLDETDDPKSNEILFRTLLESGDRFLARYRERFEQTWRAVREDDPANSCYTSGTIADPKGIILTHLNYYTNIELATAYGSCTIRRSMLHTHITD